MRSKLWIPAVLALMAGTASAQMVVSDPAMLTQSIINSANEMVNTGTTAENMIRNFETTQKIFNQGKEYYDRLRSVSNLVRSARRVQASILMLGDITQCYVTSYRRMLADPGFTARELSAIASGYAMLMQQGADALKELQDIINPSDLSMTDKDRMDVVDKCHAELLRLRTLTTYYTRRTIGVALQRARARNETERFMSLYNQSE